MANINRDYLIVNDVKKSNTHLDNGSIFFYITDKNTQNIFVNLVINISNNPLIQKYANIENAEDYTLTMNIVKPDNTYEIIHGKLHDKANAIFEFDLPDYCCDKVGSYRCELLTKCYINDREEITTSNKITYKVKSSVLNDLDEITEAPEYPLVIQLFDKLSDIEQYEEDRRANELARQLAEEQRQARFNALDADMTDSIEAMDNKVIDVENRMSAKEQAVDKLIIDTKADIDEYKTAKDQEIDEYKATKDTEINNAIAAQDNKIDTTISNQNDRITVVENNNVAQDNRLDTLENRATQHESRLDAIEVKNQQQDNRLDIVKNKNTQQDNRLNDIEAKNVEQDNRLDDIEAIDVAQNTRLDAIEVKNQEQDDRLLDIEKINKRQDMNLKCLFAESKNNMIDVTEEGNSIYLQNSTTGYTLIDEIKGNTLVNCNKEPDKELILNGNINTSGDNTVTITEGVDGGLVDVALEGNTLVNVSKTKDSTAITKAYTVENSGNHIALQGDVDGSCRPVIYGKTLVNLMADFNDSSLWLSQQLTNISNDGYVTFASNGNVKDFCSKKDIAPIKTSTTYTLIIDVKNITNGVTMKLNLAGAKSKLYGLGIISIDKSGMYLQTVTTMDSFDNCTNDIYMACYPFDGECTLRMMLLEGDYTDKPIPDYFEGLQSSFEDNLVTQEMVDNGEEVADNLGKYRVDYKSIREDGTVGSTKTLYLNSPLLEGDTIEEKDGSIYHVHRYIETMLDGSLFNNMDSDVNGLHRYYSYNYRCLNYALGENKCYCDKLPVSTIPKVDGSITFGGAGYIEYATTKSMSEAQEWLQQNPVTIVYQLNEPVYELIEQSNLAIPSYANGHLDLTSTVPVSKINFLHFEEELTYLYPATSYTIQFISDAATTADITLGGTQLLAQSIVAGLNRIAVATPATLVDNKLVINGVGANISEVIVTDTNREFGYFEGMKSVGECEELQIISANSDNSLSNTQQLTHEPLRAVGNTKDRYVLIDGKWFIEKKCGIRACQEGDKDNYKTDLVNTVYPLEIPTYEEIDFNPLEVYSGTTHITTNSVIPTNITVKNHGFNCLLKPSTIYTISSNLGLNTVTTPSTLTEDCLRFYDTDTSDVTTMRDVLVLEGDWTTKADLIPSNFSGIESAFEQEYDAEKGKYKVNVKVANEDKTKENNITFYIDEPLRGVGDSKDRVFIQDEKVMIQRNCGNYTFNGSADENWEIYRNLNEYKTIHFKSRLMEDMLPPNTNKAWGNNICLSNIFSTEKYYLMYKGEDRQFLSISNSVYEGIAISINKNNLQSQDTQGFKQWLQNNPVTVVYQLAEPVYEEIEYNDTKLFIESFKNSTLSYNSNVPVTSKLYYSYSVPIVDTVAQTANISDEQDQLIINLATEVAILEMMTM